MDTSKDWRMRLRRWALGPHVQALTVSVYISLAVFVFLIHAHPLICALAVGLLSFVVLSHLILLYRLLMLSLAHIHMVNIFMSGDPSDMPKPPSQQASKLH